MFLGIPYLSHSSMNKIIEQNEEREAKYENEKEKPISVPETFKKFMEDSKYVFYISIIITKLYSLLLLFVQIRH